jgi:hypothetical protein
LHTSTCYQPYQCLLRAYLKIFIHSAIEIFEICTKKT